MEIEMELYVGGCFQGKLDYVCRKKNRKKEEFIDETLWKHCKSQQQLLEACLNYMGINHVHLLIQKLLCMEVNPETFFRQLFDQKSSWILICDEVGYGIVPLKKEERVYRETVGRVLCMVARQADHMERIIGGYGMIIK